MLAARGEQAVALQARVDELQKELASSYSACAQASQALLTAREAAAAADRREKALSGEVATLRADLAASRERVAELVAAVRRGGECVRARWDGCLTSPHPLCACSLTGNETPRQRPRTSWLLD